LSGSLSMCGRSDTLLFSGPLTGTPFQKSRRRMTSLFQNNHAPLRTRNRCSRKGGSVRITECPSDCVRSVAYLKPLQQRFGLGVVRIHFISLTDKDGHRGNGKPFHGIAGLEVSRSSNGANGTVAKTLPLGLSSCSDTVVILAGIVVVPPSIGFFSTMMGSNSVNKAGRNALSRCLLSFHAVQQPVRPSEMVAWAPKFAP
jgi:hypothetical protein